MAQLKEARSCTCAECISPCEHGRPGWFAPGEAEKAAELLGVTFEEFKRRFLMLDYWVGGSIVLSPRTDLEPAGFPMAPYWPENGRCVFLDENDRCRIHKAKPMECARTVVCADPVHGGPSLRDTIQQLWDEAGNPLGPRDEWGDEEDEADA